MNDQAIQMNPLSSFFRLEPEKSLVLCIDMQERMTIAMDSESLAKTIKNVSFLLQGAMELNIPILVTEQYRKVLLLTFAELQKVLSPKTPRFEKMEFSAWANQQIRQAITDTGRTQIIVMGMEAHVCIFQTVRDLLEQSYAVQLPKDAVISRNQEDQEGGISLCQQAGAVITTTEAILFDWLKQGGTPSFKKISAMLKNKSSS